MSPHVPFIIAGAIIGIFTAGFTVGMFAGKYVTKKEFKEHEAKNSLDLNNHEIQNKAELEKIFDKIGQLFDKVEYIRGQLDG